MNVSESVKNERTVASRGLSGFPAVDPGFMLMKTIAHLQPQGWDDPEVTTFWSKIYSP